MFKDKLGFGLMRLPVLADGAINYDELNPMVDAFLDAGYSYFDTSYDHGGLSEEAAQKAVVERHPRDRFTIATKFPTFSIQGEDQVEPIFQSQLKKLGVDYIDYYLLHNMQTLRYDGIDGNGGIVQKAHLFDHLAQWKKDGKVKHIGFSFHSSAKLLDRILTEHPEVEFVQLAVNYLDWTRNGSRRKSAARSSASKEKSWSSWNPSKAALWRSCPMRRRSC